MNKSVLQKIWDFLGFPLRAFLLDETWQHRLRLTTLKTERIMMAATQIRGRVLDIGCGTNDLIRWYRQSGGVGFGVDVYNFGGADLIVDTTRLPLRDEEFDTVCFIANLNHIPKSQRKDVILEARRVLKENGIVVVTMIGPFIGWLCHKLTWWDPDQRVRQIDFSEEDVGLSSKYVIDLITKSGFCLIYHKKFVYGMNNLFVFRKCT